MRPLQMSQPAVLTSWGSSLSKSFCLLECWLNLLARKRYISG